MLLTGKFFYSFDKDGNIVKGTDKYHELFQISDDRPMKELNANLKHKIAKA